VNKPDLSVDLAGIALKSPVMTASGCAASGKELNRIFDITKLGAMITKSIMMEPRQGRATPRMAETPSGMLNSIGLQGPGIERFIEEDLAWLAEIGMPTIVSIAGTHVHEYAELTRRLRSAPAVVGIEVNISCPNHDDRDHVFACDPVAASKVIEAVRRSASYDLPIFAKLSPDVTDIVDIARAVVKAGADGLTLINTVLGMAIDEATLRPILSAGTGGLSGPAIRPIAIRCIYQVREALPEVPIIGVGGVSSGQDGMSFIAAGANALSVGTNVFSDPNSPMKIHHEIAETMSQRGFTSLSDVLNLAHTPLHDPQSEVAQSAQVEEAVEAPSTRVNLMRL
jgi:dihydroorotate dehydrogenase (NAD+) catalytic subunit